MLINLLFSSMFALLVLNISSPLKIHAEHKNNLINKFCIASLKSKLNIKNKKNIKEISDFTCDCFFKKYKSGNSLKSSRIYCRDKASEKYNL